ncbi:MAG TPA: GAF domain-containing protein [Gemmatimonadaceae bacterium]
MATLDISSSSLRGAPSPHTPATSSAALELDRVAAVARVLMRGAAAFVALADDEGLVIRGADGLPSPSAKPLDVDALPSCAAAMHTGRVQTTNRLTPGEREQLEAALGCDVRQLVVAPLTADGISRGVVACVNAESGRFSVNDAEGLKHLGALAGAWSRVEARSHAERRGALEASVLAELVRQLNETLDVDHVASLIAADAVRLLDAQGAVLTIRDGNDLIAVAAAGAARTELGRRVPIASTISGEALRLGQAVRSRNVFWVPYWTTTHATVSNAAPNAIAVPLRAGDASIGALMVYGSTADFTDHDATMLEALASHAGVALHNAQLFAAQGEERALAEAGAALARAALDAPSVAATATQVVDIVARAIQPAGLALGVRLPAGDALICAAAYGRLQPLVGQPMPLDDQLTSTGAATLPAEAWGCDPATDCVQAIPLLSGNRVIGVLVAALATQRRDRMTAGMERLAEPITLALDVATRAEEDRERSEREQLLASALATMDQPVFILDLARRIRYANGAAESEYGYVADELTRLSFDELVASSAPARRVDAAHLAIPGSTWKTEQVHQRKDGSRFPAAVVLSYIRDAAGDVCGQVVHLRNVTDEQRIEAQLRQSEKLAALGELVAGVAHEVNNPLAGISALAELMLEDSLSPELRESARLIKRESDRASSVVRDLLTFARKEGQARDPVDLGEVVRLATRLRAFNLRRREIRLELDLDPATPLVRGDASQLQQVVLNLIVNAEHAMQESKVRRLVVRLGPTAAGAYLAISDTGTGMTEEVKQRVFEPFFTTKPPGQGTGLGLSVSYGIVQAHGGSIGVESEPGAGTTFTIILPAAQAGRPAVHEP